eukprot:TRINITY_DN1351_c0_g3_i1.p1 TRINITY_DN1351_c0_g3~~TRINITY_DN1351_c0_g3_i1.p1  ORF type:complete len:224 (+),score=124.23 TRINITY_DN1351_c0_g3_i1:89-673(+)
MMRLAALAALFALSAQGVELNSKADYEAQVINSGKNAFIKYFAPWCGHCKRMKPDWDKLMGEFETSSSVIVADVDCTSDGGKPICDEKGVQGFPTIKYYKDGDTKGADYNGGREFDALLKFTKESLERPCDVNDPKECTDKEKEFIEKMKAKGADEIKKQLARLEGMAGKSMKADLKQWWAQRVNVLKQLAKDA